MEIQSAAYVKSSAEYTQCPKADRPEYAFIGRSNVGKSSLINMLCDKKALAKTSAAPGKTQLINHFEILSGIRDKTGKLIKSSWYLVDLPGYGYAKVSQKQRKSWSMMIERYILKRENLICLFVLIDSRHEPQKIDLEFINQLGEWQIPFVLVFTKADKNKPGATIRNVAAFLETLKESWETLPLHFVTSAVDRGGREDLLQYIQTQNQAL
ncbi:ribosome biogenesis GTP-binding protein YihA/YsxC [Niabella beijingensis]|uniref:ribosome biogenesis GTP-binding protein YihA/YsxC n=1 Tax=Niabella beijingensis TaxID=2872700 RepID=UPI001CBC956A|nr:ribosome biogenesis GTP-binding protein YihA/YsxC [Niabella beijingensis]MBZ4187926.1 ribosome biogenesis GTP-binding protein YihA/YsxC [Niabella beijingensis]